MTEKNLQEHINEENKADIMQLYKHAEIANKEMGGIKETLGILKNDVAWLKKFFWLVAGSSVGGLVTGLINLVFK